MNEFDEKAQTWDTDPRRTERAFAVAQVMRSELHLAPQTVPHALEYGCGTGLLSFALQKDLGHITLADSSSGMLAVLAEKIAAAGIRNMAPLQLDLASDPLPAQRFDLLYNLMVLHHIPDTDGVLKAFFDLLKPGGRVCIVDLEAEDGSFHGPDFDGHKGFAPARLAEKMRHLGYEAVSFHTVYHMPKQTAVGLKMFPLFMGVGRKPG